MHVFTSNKEAAVVSAAADEREWAAQQTVTGVVVVAVAAGMPDMQRMRLSRSKCRCSCPYFPSLRSVATAVHRSNRSSSR